MTSNDDHNSGLPAKRSRFNIKPYITGMLPLFVIAHFGHHTVGSMLRPLTPMIRNSLGISYTDIGLMNTAFGLTTGLSQLPAGRLADRFGPRVMVLMGVAGVALFGFFIGFTNSFAWLIVFLVLAALMGAGYHPASAAAISTSVKPEYTGRAMGVHLIGGTASFWIIPLIATLIAGATMDWRTPYLVLTIPMIILGIVLYYQVGKRGRAIEALKKLEQNDDFQTDTVSQKINWGVLAPFIIISVATGTTVQAISSYLPLYATDVLGLSEQTAGLLTAITPGIGFVAAPMGGWLADRFGGMKVIMSVAFLSVPFIYLIGRAPNVGILVTLMVLMGLTMNARMPTSESFIAAHTPASRRASVLGVYYFAGTGVAAPLAPAIGKLIDNFRQTGDAVLAFGRTYAIAAVVTGAISVLSALFLWFSSRRKRAYPRMG